MVLLTALKKWFFGRVLAESDSVRKETPTQATLTEFSRYVASHCVAHKSVTLGAFCFVYTKKGKST